jgi:Type I phosphodiesterase / nucleotide pyrophosphatase
VAEEVSLFSRTAAAGWRVGVAGWYHPYCRIFGATLTECSWEQGFAEESFNEAGPLKGAVNILKRMGNLLSFDGYFGIVPSPPDVASISQDQLTSYQSTLPTALRIVTSAELDLVFVHWPIPHPFGIYDRKTRTLGCVPGSNYLDNLELVDETLIQLRQALETSGLWDTTSILITSDHPFRRELWKDFSSHENIVRLLETVDNSQVPFILKLAAAFGLWKRLQLGPGS